MAPTFKTTLSENQLDRGSFDCIWSVFASTSGKYLPLWQRANCWSNKILKCHCDFSPHPKNIVSPKPNGQPNRHATKPEWGLTLRHRYRFWNIVSRRWEGLDKNGSLRKHNVHRAPSPKPFLSNSSSPLTVGRLDAYLVLCSAHTFSQLCSPQVISGSVNHEALPAPHA